MCGGSPDIDTPAPPPEPPHMPRTAGEPSKTTEGGSGSVFAGTLLTQDYDVPGKSLLGQSSTGGTGNLKTANG